MATTHGGGAFWTAGVGLASCEIERIITAIRSRCIETLPSPRTFENTLEPRNPASGRLRGSAPSLQKDQSPNAGTPGIKVPELWRMQWRLFPAVTSSSWRKKATSQLYPI